MTTPTLLDRAREALRGRLYELLESDDYGVHGSDFYRCPECECESGAGVLNNGIQHEVDCTIGKDFQLLADLDRARADNGWLPIESAPKDGTRILACGGDCDELQLVAWLNDSSISWKKAMAWCSPDSWQDEHGGYSTYSPTHWQPLPAPPIPTESTSQEVRNGR